MDERAIEMRAELLFKFNQAFLSMRKYVDVHQKNIVNSLANHHFNNRDLSLISTLKGIVDETVSKIDNGSTI